ncbi:MAG: hypothetical protein U0R19_27510 [Bryobacteraceae bacterium]
MNRMVAALLAASALAWPQLPRARRPQQQAPARTVSQPGWGPDDAPSYAADLMQLQQALVNRPDISGLPPEAQKAMVWRCMYSPSQSGVTPAHNRYYWFEAEPKWLASLPSDHPLRRMVEPVVQSCPRSSNRTPAQIAAGSPPPRAVMAPVTTPSRAAQPLGFTAAGLENEPAVVHLYRGEFDQVGLSRSSLQFGELFSGYLRAYGSRCDAHLPPNKVELMRSVCTREQYVENGLGQKVSGPTCIESKDVGTGVFADPVLHAAREQLGRMTNPQGLPNGLRVGPGMMADVQTMALEVRRINSDMQRLVALNGCATAPLKRFETNLIAYSEGKPGVVAAAQPAQASVVTAPFVESNYTKLIDDLIAEQARSWALNRFVTGSTKQVFVQGRDEYGRPSMISANYSYRGMGGAAPGSVRLDFANGEPECLYFFDAPTSCRKASRRSVNAYLEGAYR